jgi:polysaccharide export outer membrane protein
MSMALRFSGRLGGCIAGLAVCALVLLAPASARADYLLAIGDVLELSAVGVPELRQKMPIGQDGTISVPLAGQLQVSGLTLEQVRGKIREILPRKEFRRHTQEGREYPVILSPGDIDVAISEYRPVYLNGDVAKPGEQPFRPGLTVRQAIALAGGYDIMHFRMNNPFLEQSDLKSEYNSLWAEFAKEQVHIARIRAELSGKQEIDSQALQQTPLPAKVGGEFERLGAEELSVRNSDYSKEKGYLAEAVGKEDGRIKILADQLHTEKAGVDADSSDLSQLQDLLKKGTIVSARVVEARRALLLSSVQYLQTQASLAQVERERQEFKRRSDKLDDQRRLDLLAELQKANVNLATVQAKLAASSEKLVYVGMVRSQLVNGTGSKPQIALHRKNAQGSNEEVTAGEDTQLAPGDVIEVSLQADLIPGVPAR